MKTIIAVISLLASTLYSFAQDVIIRTNGVRIDCKITKVDSTTIYLNLHRNGNELQTSISKSEVKQIIYADLASNSLNLDSAAINKKFKNSLTIGILQGGGSLIGVDYEILAADYFGLQAGIGLRGFGGGIDIHFHPNIRSSFASIQYWHQGIGNTYTQSIIGPCYVFRGKRWLTFQIGLGFPIEKGSNFPSNMTQPPIMLTYAIGVYIPW
jgi:hypothetical protein